MIIQIVVISPAKSDKCVNIIYIYFLMYLPNLIYYLRHFHSIMLFYILGWVLLDWPNFAQNHINGNYF